MAVAAGDAWRDLELVALCSDAGMPEPKARPSTRVPETLSSVVAAASPARVNSKQLQLDE